MVRLIEANLEDIPDGKRDTSGTPLNEKEILYVKSEISRIGADESVFIFNDDEHIHSDTRYDIAADKIFITRNVFPDMRYCSSHPRDILSVAALLAREYYGRRPCREEYLSDSEKGDGYHTAPAWQDECRASIDAAKTAPCLSRGERHSLIDDAVYIADENGYLIEPDDFMKEVIFGSSDVKEETVRSIAPIHFVMKPEHSGSDQTGGPESSRHGHEIDM